MTTLLPLGAYVRVTERNRTYIARVVGYDLGRTKYRLGARFAGWDRWLFAESGSWAFPGDVEEITEEVALS